MKKGSVKHRILKLGLRMVTVALVVFLVSNMFVYHFYGEAIADEWKELMEDWLVKRNEFILFVAVDVLFCIRVFVIAGWFFAKKLAAHIMVPLKALEDGAERIKNNDLTGSIEYIGDREFESVCDTFNDMCKAILAEQEKNRKYEKARTDMIAGISHDLRTPLTAIRGSGNKHTYKRHCSGSVC